MTLRDNLRTIALLKHLRFTDTVRDNTFGNTYLNYNEMTFIPFLHNNKANRVVNKGPSIKDSIDKVAGFIKTIQETDLNSLTTPFEVNKYSSSIAININDNKNISLHTSLQAEINGAWIDFYCYGQDKSVKKDPSAINKFEDQRELINQVAKDLDAKHNEFNRFLLFYYTLSEQLPKSMLHEEDRLYVVASINKYAEQMPDIKELSSLYEQYNDLNAALLKDIKENLIALNPDTFVTKADAFIAKELQHQANNSVENFLATKLFSDQLLATVEFTAAQKIDKAFVFDDNSIAYKRNNQYHTIKDNDGLTAFISDIHHEGLAFMLRKKPKTISFFQNKLKEDSEYGNSIKAATSFLEHSQILKQYNFDLNNFTDKSFELLDDTINNLVYKNKIKQFAYSILSAKYKHYFNEETEPYFKALFDNDVTTSQLQTFVGKKLAALNSNEDVISMLNGILNHVDGFTQEALTEKLAAWGIEKIHDNNNVVTFEVTDYEQCKALGTSSWCIVRDEDYFDQYVTDRKNNQYLIYDFNKLSTDIESMVGFTVDNTGNIYAEHWKDDSSIGHYNKADSLVAIQTDTIYKNQNRHTLSEETIADMEDILGIKDVKQTKHLKMRFA